MDEIVAVFAKSPVPGQVKTRLVPPLTYGEAASVYEASLFDVLDLVRGVTAKSLLFHEPDSGSAEYFGALRPPLELRAQRGEELGERMANAFEEAFSEGAAVVCLIGADSPTLPPAVLREAPVLLTASDAVLGPAEDGGYYLIGLRRSAWPAARTLFRGIRFSEPTVLRETLAAARAAGLSVSLLPQWYDVDSIDDLLRASRDAVPGSHLARAVSRVLGSGSAARSRQGPRIEG